MENITKENPLPLQPIYKDENGTFRFVENKVVSFLLKEGGIDMNRLAMEDFSNADREQFAQLIGYSLSGFGDLSYVSDIAYNLAYEIANSQEENNTTLTETQKLKLENAFLKKELNNIKDLLRTPISVIFNIDEEELS